MAFGQAATIRALPGSCIQPFAAVDESEGANHPSSRQSQPRLVRIIAMEGDHRTHAESPARADPTPVNAGQKPRGDLGMTTMPLLRAAKFWITRRGSGAGSVKSVWNVVTIGLRHFTHEVQYAIAPLAG